MFRTIAILWLLTAICAAEPPRFFNRRAHFARQQQLPPAAPTQQASGYPAAGHTPEVPFELPTTARPTGIYLPPQVAQQPEDSYGPPETQPDEPNVDTETVEAEGNVLLTVAEDGTVIAVSTAYDQGQDGSSNNRANPQQPSARLSFQRLTLSPRNFNSFNRFS